MAKRKKKNKGFDIGQLMKPINPTPIIIAAIVGLGSSLGAGVVGDSARSHNASTVDCSYEISHAIDDHKAAPTIKLRYSGPVEDQCRINEILDRVP